MNDDVTIDTLTKEAEAMVEATAEEAEAMVEATAEDAETMAELASAFSSRASDLVEVSQLQWKAAVDRSKAMPERASALISNLDETKNFRSALQKKLISIDKLREEIDLTFQIIVTDIRNAFTEVTSDSRTSIANGATSAASDIEEAVTNVATGTERDFHELLERTKALRETLEETLRDGGRILSGAEATISRVVGDATSSCQTVCALVGSTVEVVSSDVGRVGEILDDAISVFGGTG